MSKVKLYKGDTIENMRKIASNSVHLILADLPYGETGNKWGSLIDLEMLWEEYKRILKPGGGSSSHYINEVCSAANK